MMFASLHYLIDSQFTVAKFRLLSSTAWSVNILASAHKLRDDCDIYAMTIFHRCDRQSTT
jgi:hypothetical protein